VNLDDLITFLNARLDEDEAAAKAAASVAGPDWHHDLFWDEAEESATVMIFSAAGSPLADMLHRDEEMAPFIARFDPARVLREIAAKRAVLGLFVSAFGGVPVVIHAGSRTVVGGWLLRLWVAAYDDHPDYRQEWTP
jgi:Family of unknown function (DUF6221)